MGIVAVGGVCPENGVILEKPRHCDAPILARIRNAARWEFMVLLSTTEPADDALGAAGKQGRAAAMCAADVLPCLREWSSGARQPADAQASVPGLALQVVAKPEDGNFPCKP